MLITSSLFTLQQMLIPVTKITEAASKSVWFKVLERYVNVNQAIKDMAKRALVRQQYEMSDWRGMGIWN